MRSTQPVDNYQNVCVCPVWLTLDFIVHALFVYGQVMLVVCGVFLLSAHTGGLGVC